MWRWNLGLCLSQTKNVGSDGALVHGSPSGKIRAKAATSTKSSRGRCLRVETVQVLHRLGIGGDG